MKTAGTSFRRMLNDSLGMQLYPSNLELRNNNKGWYLDNHEIVDKVKNDKEFNLNERRVVCGHYPYNLGGEILSNPFYATFLREPVARTLSIIGHRKKLSPEFKDASVSEVLDKLDLMKRQVTNYQTKIFAIDDFKLKYVNSEYFVGEKQFELALNRLQKMDFIGLTEQFETSVEIFKNKTGIALKDIQIINKGIDLTVEEEDIVRIKELVNYDILLYEEALKLFEKQCNVIK